MPCELTLKTDTPALFSEIAEVVRLFYPADIRPGDEGADICHRHEETHAAFIDTFTFRGRTLQAEAPAVRGGLEEKRFKKRAVKTACFRLLMEATGTCPPWGSLTGIRPTRVYYEALASGMDEAQVEAYLKDTFFVSDQKASLLTEIVRAQRGLIGTLPDEFDVYVGIPFCTTRCSYCSFSSGEIGSGALVGPYLDALFREIDACSALTKGLRPRAVYIGGGTPTAISRQALSSLLQKLRAAFPGAREWTVEAGRPDTIDRGKLEAILDAGVKRISINPQSFHDETLRAIGRAHTAEDTYRAFELARAMGCSNINMDLIAALPGEGEREFFETLNKVRALSPENVTIHTLAIKRASGLNESGYAPDARGVAGWIHRARGILTESGYTPYYIYRQKYMAGNLENVGYAKPGMGCLYNVDNMEETTPVLALGAGAITKWLFQRELRIERAPNVKNIEQYILRVDEMINRKRALMNRE